MCGFKNCKKYDLSKTPHQRLLESSHLTIGQKEELIRRYSLLNPIDIRNGQLGCDIKKNSNLCHFSIKYKTQMGFIFYSDIYCPITPNIGCPDVDVCFKQKLKSAFTDKTFEDVVKIVNKNNLSSAKFTDLKKLSRDEAKTLAVALSKLDINILRGLSSKDISKIEEFKNLPIEKQVNQILKPRKYETLVIAGAVAAAYVTAQTAQAYKDSFLGGDHLNAKDKKTNDNQFDLKD